MLAAVPFHHIVDTDATRVQRVRESVLPKNDGHLTGQTLGVQCLQLADPRCNPFADPFVLLAVGRDGLTTAYQRFLAEVRDAPDSTQAERVAAESQLKGRLGFGDFPVLMAIHEFRRMLRAEAFLFREDTYDRAIALEAGKPTERAGLRKPLGIFADLDRREVESLVRRFVDASQLPEAVSAVCAAYGITNPDDGLQHAYEYFLEGRVQGEGEYSLKEWMGFVDAHRYARQEALVGRKLSIELLCEFNALLLEDDIRKSGEAFRVKLTEIGKRSNTLAELFDQNGRYKSCVPVDVPFEGFYLAENLTRSTAGVIGRTPVQRVLMSWVHDLMDVGHEQLYTGSSECEMLRSLREVIPRKFSHLNIPLGEEKGVRIIMTADPVRLREHLQAVCDYFNREAEGIARRVVDGDLEAGSQEYVQEVTYLAAAVARVSEAPHFPRQANCRTGLLTERYLCAVLGVEIGDSLNGSVTVKVRKVDGTLIEEPRSSENGTWMVEKDRQELLFNSALTQSQPLNVCERACRRFLAYFD
jgi:hypothetical protein